jgi:hypothetical protein
MENGFKKIPFHKFRKKQDVVFWCISQSFSISKFCIHGLILNSKKIYYWNSLDIYVLNKSISKL